MDFSKTVSLNFFNSKWRWASIFGIGCRARTENTRIAWFPYIFKNQKPPFWIWKWHLTSISEMLIEPIPKLPIWIHTYTLAKFIFSLNTLSLPYFQNIPLFTIFWKFLDKSQNHCMNPGQSSVSFNMRQLMIILCVHNHFYIKFTFFMNRDMTKLIQLCESIDESSNIE